MPLSSRGHADKGDGQPAVESESEEEGDVGADRGASPILLLDSQRDHTPAAPASTRNTAAGAAGSPVVGELQQHEQHQAAPQQHMSREELRLEKERMEVLKEQRRLAAFEFQNAGYFPYHLASQCP